MPFGESRKEKTPLRLLNKTQWGWIRFQTALPLQNSVKIWVASPFKTAISPRKNRHEIRKRKARDSNPESVSFGGIITANDGVVKDALQAAFFSCGFFLEIFRFFSKKNFPPP